MSGLLVFGIISLTSDLIFSTAPETAGKINPVQKIEGSGSHVRVSHAPDLNPEEGENFILTAWFKFRKLPDDGESFVLLSKVDSFLRSQRGYRLSLTREAGRIRPVVYWRNSDAIGGVYRFSPFDLRPHQWVMFGLSFSEGRYLGLHTVIRVPSRKPEVVLLGGYTLSTPVYPDASSDLYFGAFSGPPYKGSIGPVSILSMKERKDSLYRIFKETGVDGRPPIDLFGEDEVKLYVDETRTDRSTFKNLVTFSSEIRTMREDESDEGKSGNIEETPPPLTEAAPTPAASPSPTAIETPAAGVSALKTKKKHADGGSNPPLSGKTVKKIPAVPVKRSSEKKEKTDA